MSWEQTISFSGQRFFQPRANITLPTFAQDARKNIVVHLRIGDSIRLDTRYCPVILYGDKIYTDLEHYYAEVGQVDPRRHPEFNPYDLSQAVRGVLASRGGLDAETYLVSDGFTSSKRWIMNHIYSRRIPMRVGISALRCVNALEKRFGAAFEWIPESRQIIGEGQEATIKTIDLLASAATIITNSGGFRNVIHYLYSQSPAEGGFVWLKTPRDVVV
jgi:hypothetical protein